ncbi:MAG TPA: AAA family ATPase [Acidimicrobiales bacterium]|nr:AAA family ATPase [Acidimicrobiales bacterium]
MIGRDAEVRSLRALVAAVEAGHPGIALITGQGGIGKSRLAGEVLAEAAAAGFAVLRGAGHVIGQQLAFAPVTQALAPFLHDLTASERLHLGAGLSHVGAVLSSLGLETPPPLNDPQLERARLVDGLAQLLWRIAERQPVALLIDDLHLADRPTWELVHHLTRATREVPLLVVVGARPVPDPGSASLLTATALLEGLQSSEWHVSHCALGPLAPTTLPAFVEAVLRAPAHPAVVEAAVARGGAVPFLLESLVRTMADFGQLAERNGRYELAGPVPPPVPEEVRAHLRARLATLPDDEDLLVSLLAVAPEGVASAVLTEAAEVTPVEQAAAVERLCRRSLVVVDSGPGAVRHLAHDLLREAAAAELGLVATRRRHLALARALAAVDPDSPHLAEHQVGAGPLCRVEEALHARRALAARELQLGHPEQAVAHLEAYQSRARHDRRRADPDLLVDLADARERAGDLLGAARDFRAAAAPRHIGERVARAGALRRLALVQWEQAEFASAERTLRHAMSVLATEAPSPEQAEVLLTRVSFALRQGDREEVRRHVPALSSLSSAVHSPSVTARALVAVAGQEIADGEYEASHATLDRALVVANAAGDPLIEQHVLGQQGLLAATVADVDTLVRVSRTSLALARRVGAPLLELRPRGRLALGLLLGGEWSEAVDLADDSVRLARELESRRALPVLAAIWAMVLTRLGKYEDAQAALTLAASGKAAHGDDRNAGGFVDLAEAELLLATDRAADAPSLGGRLVEWVFGWTPLVALAVAADLHLARGEEDPAAVLAGRLENVRGPHPFAGLTARWIRARLDPSGWSADAFRALADGYEAAKMPYAAARCRLFEAGATHDRDPVSAAAAGKAALAGFERLGAAADAERARSLLREHGVVPSRGRARVETGTALTVRELEVVRLVATGLTNAEVAKRLFVSPRTVTTHLSHIYRRLGISSRVALVHYATRERLLDPTPD